MHPMTRNIKFSIPGGVIFYIQFFVFLFTDVLCGNNRVAAITFSNSGTKLLNVLLTGSLTCSMLDGNHRSFDPFSTCAMINVSVFVLVYASLRTNSQGSSSSHAYCVHECQLSVT